MKLQGRAVFVSIIHLLTDARLSNARFTLPFDQSTVGCGAPFIGIFMSIGSPALTLSFLLRSPSRKSLGASEGYERL